MDTLLVIVHRQDKEERMSSRRKGNVDIRSILHHIQQGVSDRRIARELEVNRRTVQQYRKWAEEQGLLAGALPPPE